MASSVALKGCPLATLLRQLLADAPSTPTGRPVTGPAAFRRTAPAPPPPGGPPPPPPPEGASLRRYDVVDESGPTAARSLRVFSKFSLGDDSTVDLILGARDADQAESDGFLRRLDDDR
uniref:Uncharacterized protein n=1 Tax=Oryza glaberrima TaxID=4538 RepID=I1QNJ9_ORYGL